MFHSARRTSGVSFHFLPSSVPPLLPAPQSAYLAERTSNRSLGNVDFEERAQEWKFVLVLKKFLGIVVETEVIFCLQVIQKYLPPNSVPTPVTQFTPQLI